MAAHPLLLDSTPAVPQSNRDRYKPMQPKFASIRVLLLHLFADLYLTSYCPVGQRTNFFFLPDANAYTEDPATDRVCFRDRQSLCRSGSERPREWF